MEPNPRKASGRTTWLQSQDHGPSAELGQNSQASQPPAWPLSPIAGKCSQSSCHLTGLLASLSPLPHLLEPSHPRSINIDTLECWPCSWVKRGHQRGSGPALALDWPPLEGGREGPGGTCEPSFSAYIPPQSPPSNPRGHASLRHQSLENASAIGPHSWRKRLGALSTAPPIPDYFPILALLGLLLGMFFPKRRGIPLTFSAKGGAPLGAAISKSALLCRVRCRAQPKHLPLPGLQ